MANRTADADVLNLLADTGPLTILDIVQHFAVTESPEAGLDAILSDDLSQTANIRVTGFIQTFGPGREAVQQAGGKTTAIPDMLQAVFRQDGAGRQDVEKAK